MATKIHGLFFPTDTTENQVVEVHRGEGNIGPHDINSTKWVPFPAPYEAATFRLTDVGRERFLVVPGEIYKCYIYHSYKVRKF